MSFWDLHLPPRPVVAVRSPIEVSAVGDALCLEDLDHVFRALFFPFHRSLELVEGLLGQKNRL